MSQTKLYPLQFEPIFEYRIWGGRRLADILNVTLPGDGPIGEAWILSDRDDHPSIVANGPLKGKTIKQLLEQFPDELLGKPAGRFPRFPLLLKFLDAQAMLSVQVHPSDANKDMLPPGERGKTEAWVVMEAEKDSRIYAGLKPGTTKEIIKGSLANDTVSDHLNYFTPKPGDGVFIPAGTVHTLGNNVVVFEVQQNSDVTFRLYDWGHIDSKTGQPRPLQIEKAIASIDFSQGAVSPVIPIVEDTNPVFTERLFLCEFFALCRHVCESQFIIGEEGMPRVLVCIEGEGELDYNGLKYPISIGNVILLPAAVGACVFNPTTAVNILEISLP